VIIGGGTLRGFTIVEIAVALFLVTLLFGTIFMPLHARLDNRKIEQTEDLLANAREALLGYAAARGYLPCPATEASGGQEAPGSDHGTGVCATYYGFFPAAALGLATSDQHGYLVDAWATRDSRIRYAVADQAIGPASNTNALTRVNGMRAAGISNLSDPALSLFYVCGGGKGVSPGRNCGSTPTLASTVPAVIWSPGANAVTGGTSLDEAQNPNPKGGSADRIFVSRVRSTVSGNEFDDIVTWIPMPILIERMLSAGNLP
jgi:type II secretory pathway pseudopilin PulG